MLISTSPIFTFAIFAFVIPWALLSLYRGDVEDYLRIDIGRHSWWLALLVAAVSAPLGIQAIHADSSVPLARWQAVGGLSFVSGLILFLVGPGGGLALVMLVKVVLILLVPITCLLASAIDGRGKPVTLRIVFALAAGVGIVMAVMP